MTCAPQRFLANNRNVVRDAVLTPSQVRPVSNQVQSIKVARDGTAQVALSGEYTGTEEAQYDVEILDTTATVARTSRPVFSGAGSGDLANIVASIAAQQIVVELADVGLPTTFASIDFEGVQISARASGPGGNAIHISIDQSTLVFSDTSFSLLEPLTKGQGGPTSGIEGAAFDWDCAVAGQDDVIPATAHRVAFGEDTSAIYLQYKKYVDGVWLVYFVPELKRDVQAGTPVKFVTGGRTVEVTDDVTPETYTGVVTLYDFLNDLKTFSALVTVDGVVANDRTPTGQASQELLTRTDAHVEPSTGTGSAASRGFEDTFAGSAANTELVTATCYAVTSTDHPLARLGLERWEGKGSVSGDLGIEIVTGVPFSVPTKFGFTIPTRLPTGFGNGQRGRFSVTAINYVPRNDPDDAPPICVVARKLGTEATDQTITLTWTKRPSGACVCDDMPIPNIGGPCLGDGTDEEGGSVSYSADGILRVKMLYDLGARIVIALTAYVDGQARDNIPDEVGASAAGTGTITQTIDDSTISYPVTTAAGPPPLVDITSTVGQYADVKFPDALQNLFDDYETALQTIDAVVDNYLRDSGFDAWEDALDALDTDLCVDCSGPVVTRLVTVATAKYQVLLRKAIAYAGESPLGKSSASTELDSGDGCWRDWNDPYYWTVVGAKGAYAPAFNNHPYYSSRQAEEDGKYFATKEFGFQINIKCPEKLIVDDEIVLTIGDAGWGATYQVGDVETLPIIGAQDLYLVGGQDGNDLLTWYVTGDVDGPFPPFVYDTTLDNSYSATAGLSFDLVPGGIPFAQGDTFVFSVEGGHFQWRKDSGAWNGPFDIPDGPISFDAGLDIEFTGGEAPSFVAGDTFSFTALQPWAASNIQSPLPNRWEWGDDTGSASVNVVMNLGAVELIESVSIALHTLPQGCTITLEGGTSPGVYTWTETITWRQRVIFQELLTPQNSQYLRMTIDNAQGAGIGWIWAGSPLTQERQADGQLKRTYRVQRADAGLFQGGVYQAMAVSGDVEWSEGALTETDISGLASFMDWVKSNNDEPFVFVPQNTRPDEAFLERIVVDEVEMTDVFRYGKNATYDRAFSVRLPLAGVWQ